MNDARSQAGEETGSDARPPVAEKEGCMREGFAEIVSGWTLIDGMEDITDRIERASEWTRENGPLNEHEQKTIELMIQCQVSRVAKRLSDLV